MLHVYFFVTTSYTRKPQIPPLNQFNTDSTWLKSSKNDSHYVSLTLRLILSLQRGHVGQPF